MSFKLKTFSAFVVTAAMVFLIHHDCVAGAEWALKRDKEGIQVFTRKTAGHLTSEYKGVATVKAPMAGAIALFEDTARMPEWLYQCTEFKEISPKNSGEKIFYFRQTLPGGAHQRDVYVSRVTARDPLTKTVTYTFFHIPGRYPVQINVRRMPYFKAVWRFTPRKDDTVAAEYQFEANPGGNIPVWLFDNVFYVDLAFYSLSRFKELAMAPIHDRK